MASCSRCNAPGADLFSLAGEMVCRFCFTVGLNAQAEAEARPRASLRRDAPTRFKLARRGVPPRSPRAMITGGFAVLGFAVLFALGTVVAFKRIYPF